MNIEDKFAEFMYTDFGEFDKVVNKRSSCKDIHALLLLESLGLIEGNCAITAIGHDEMYPNVNDEALDTLTDDVILELVRCGVTYNEDMLVFLV